MLRKNILSVFVFLIIGVHGVFAGWVNPLPSRIGAGVSNTCNPFKRLYNARTFDAKFQSDVFLNPSDYQDKSVINRIVLGIDRSCVGPFTRFTANAPYELEVDILVEYLDYAKATQWLTAGFNLGSDACPGSCATPPTKTSVTKTLKIKYDPRYQTTETELSFFSFEGGYDVSTTVQAIRKTISGVTDSIAPENAYIENIIAIERYQNLDMFSSTSLSFAPNPMLPNEEGTLTINSSIDGAESYDIEWLYIDWYSGATVPSGQGRFAFDFKNNATRVTVKDLSYKIPLIYPEGILLFRVRANGVALPNTDDLISTQWYGASLGSVDVAWASGTISPVAPTGTVYGYKISGYNKAYTWQHSVSFAEESKKKQVISYFDGALYNRQSVTKNNTTDAAIVGQTIYDFNGRPAVQILPTPVPSASPYNQNLAYKQNFNQTNDASRSGKNYNYQDFDIDASNCSKSKTARLSSSSGSEQYYSSNNPLSTSLYRDRIPSANGYAFSQVEYMPDNTGRIRRQSGVGEAHRLTGDNENNALQSGKETKYYYGVPYQRDLYRLFANEAGDANRYKKNIVIDPNGQVSVSYIDPMGRVVATALGGDPANSPNMLPVAGRNPLIATVDITEGNTKNYVDLTISSENDLFVVNNGSINKFWYKLAVPMLNYQCGASDFCFDCVYDLTISITDECGTELVPINYQSNKVGLTASPEHECGVDSIIFETDGYFQLTLNQGAYKIKKTISIDKAALENYIDELLASPNIADCVTSYDDLVLQEKGKLDYTNCNYTCQKCSTDVADLLNEGKISQNEYNERIKGCDVFCKQTTPCDALYVQMVADMSPGGQYFDNLPQDAAYTAALGSGTTDDLLPGTPNNTWLDNNDGSFSYFFGATGDLTVKLNQSGVVINTWSDVRDHWIDEFSEILVEMHPEYCLYHQCSTYMQGSYAYDDAIRNTTTAADAIANGYYNPTDMTVNIASTFPNASNKDPFFTGVGSAYKTALENELTNYKTINSTNYNAWEFVDYWVESLGSDIEGCLTDYGWTLFRSIYLEKKQKQVNAYYADNSRCGSISIATGFRRRFYYDEMHDDDDFAAAFNNAPIPGAGATQSTFDAYVKTQMDAHCEKACSAYIDNWKQSLAGCGLTTLQMDAVITNLLAVCQGGCDASNPMGARQVLASVTTSPRTFQEALAGHYVAGICDELLIEWPKSNYHDYWAEINPNSESCSCAVSQQAPTPPLDCPTCTESLTTEGSFIKTNMDLIGKEKCKNCITCSVLAKSIRELDERYSNAIDDTDPKWQNIIENYLNNQYRFNLTYVEYKQFMADCINQSSFDENTLDDFRTSYDNYVSTFKEKSIFDYLESEKYVSTDTLNKPLFILKNTPLAENKVIEEAEPLVGYMPSKITTNYVKLDECGCEQILNANSAYLSISSPPVPFSTYMNLSGDCEGEWVNVDNLLNACLAARKSDASNDTEPLAAPFTSIQKNVLKEIVKDDISLVMPENCACGEEWEEPLPNVELEECDCLNDALFAYFSALETLCNYTFTINGTTPVSKYDFYDYVTTPRLLSSTKLVNGEWVEYYSYSKCAYAKVESYLIPSIIPNFPVSSCDLHFSEFVKSYNCEGTALFGSYDFSLNFCDKCYQKDNSQLANIKNFLNQIIVPDVNGDTYLTRSGWNVSTHASSYISYFYGGASCSSTLEYTIDKWTTNPEVLSFKITDNCAYDKLWSLAYISPGVNNLFSNIELVLDIYPLQNEKCQNTSTFILKVRVRQPNSTATYDTYIVGTAQDILMLVEDTENCKKLCNKPILPVVEPVDYCTDFLDRVAESNAATLYEQQIADLRRDFTNQYIEKCMGAFDYLHRQYTADEYHYTLYYYDQADNLIKTVPPKGVILLDDNSIDSAYKYVSAPLTEPRIMPNHRYITDYKYNTLNQLTEQSTPDAGISKFWYDRLGRIVLSQNSKQATYNNRGRKKYSYTMYDKLGRIIEAGELQTTATVTPDNTATDTWITTTIVNSTEKTQITHTYYDYTPGWQTALGITNFTPTNLRNRVVATAYYETYPANPEDYNHATHYSYDVLGNVHQLVQDMPQLEAMGQRYKQVLYNYDLASGNVNMVSYQPGEADQFFHYYEYDADNRITKVRTARNPAISEVDRSRTVPELNAQLGWQNDAKYLYYDHGPLARVELGENDVQGTDYSYTIHGWLKTINDGLMQNAHDPGLDGYIPASGTQSNQWFGRDAAAVELGYYKSNAASTFEDYTAIGNNGHISGKTSSNFGDAIGSLFNGNISSMITTLPDKLVLDSINMIQASSRGAVYQYDQLNRMRESWSFTNTDIPNYQWNNNLSPGTIPQEWLTQYTYDAMGNIETLRRQGGTGAIDMDQLTYNYDYGTPNWKNQLLHVDDSKVAGLHIEDIDDQDVNNYTYDEIGNLTADVAEEIQTIEWTVYGKIKTITRTSSSTKPNLEFEYNTAGQRVVKKVLPNDGDRPTITYYMRDASGNIMATYKHYYEIIDIPTEAAEERLAVQEFDIYGSSRLGTLNKEVIVASRVGVYTSGAFIPGTPATYTIAGPLDVDITDEKVGYKNYELTNHLGNVLATITDRKVPIVNGSSYDYFNAQVVSMADYYPFGMKIEERSWSPRICNLGFQRLVIEIDPTITSFHMIIATDESGEFESQFCITGACGTNVVATFDEGMDLVVAYYNSIDGFKASRIGNIITVDVDQCKMSNVYSVDSYYSPSPILSWTNTTIQKYSDNYRFGFNGQEKDNEVSGDGNSYTAEFWQYDSRLGRRWNVDPVVQEDESGYATFRNSPIILNDPNGDCPTCPKDAEVGATHLSQTNDGLALNGHLTELSKNAKNFLYYNIGNDANGNATWRIAAFEQNGSRYVWDNDKSWYTDQNGKELSTSWYFDATNGVMSLVAPVVQMATDHVHHDDAFKSIREAYQKYNGNLAGFVWSGIKQTLADAGSEGEKGVTARWSLFGGFLSSGAYVYSPALSAQALPPGTTTLGIFPKLIHPVYGWRGIQIGSAQLTFGYRYLTGIGTSFRFTTRTGRMFAIDFHTVTTQPLRRMFHLHYGQTGIFSMKNHILPFQFGFKNFRTLLKTPLPSQGYRKLPIYNSLLKSKF